MLALVPVLSLALLAQPLPIPAEAAPQPSPPAEPSPRAEAAPPLPAMATLVGGQTLGEGGAATLAAVGFPGLSVLYAQGTSPNGDVGGSFSFDWTTTEIQAGLFLRHAVFQDRDTQLSLRLRLGLYADLGTTWFHGANRSDVGPQAAPGIALSIVLPAGILSVSADLPGTWTLERRWGWILAPEAAVAFETPIYGDLSAGARLGFGVRVAGGDAPMAYDTLPVAEISGLLTYRAF